MKSNEQGPARFRHDVDVSPTLGTWIGFETMHMTLFVIETE